MWPTLDLSAEYPGGEIDINDIATIQYIPLEMTDSSLLGNPRVNVTDRYIITSNSDDNIIFFNRDGSLSHTFNHHGPSPTDYSFIDRLIIDPATDNVFVVDKMMSRVQKYDSHGNFLATVRLPQNLFQDLFLCATDTLLSIDRHGVGNPEISQLNEINTRPFNLIYEADGTDTIRPMSWTIDRPVSELYQWSSGSMAISRSLWAFPISDYGSRVIVSEAYEDTVYAISGDKRLPIMTKKNPATGNGGVKMTAIDGMNRRFILVYSIVKFDDYKDIDNTPDPQLFVYDIENPGWRTAKLVNHDITRSEFAKDSYRNRLSANIHTLPDGYMATILQAYDLCEMRDEGRLSGKLLEISQNLTEESNPILLLIRLKD